MINMKAFLSLLIGAAMFSSSASAAIFSYITEAVVNKDNQEKIHITYTYTIARWDPEPVNSKHNPCYDWDVCYLTLSHKHTKDGKPGKPERVFARIDGYKTLKEIQDKAGVRLPVSGKATHDGKMLDNTQECVGLFFQDTHDAVATRGGLLPGSLCGIAPPPVGACKIINNIPDIDFGNVAEVDLAGKTKEVSFDVTCDKEMDVLVIATSVNASNSRVNLRNDGSLYANLFLDGNTPGENGHKVHIIENGSTRVTLKAELGTNGRVEPGDFSGSAALILTVP